MITILFAREDSTYKQYGWADVYDAQRDARTFKGNGPVIAHPPCRAWGILSHMANPAKGEKELAPWAVNVVRKNGGILEHPKGSRLWKHCNLPEPGEFCDDFGGFSILIDQHDFGHVANKKTKLYICGLDFCDMPQIPEKKTVRALKSITGQVPNTKRCTQYEREYTPELLIKWMWIAVSAMRNK